MIGRQVVQDVQSSFIGGLNSAADESQVGPTEMREAGDCRLTEYGGVTKRLGTQRVHDDDLAVIDNTAGIAGGTTWRRTVPATHVAACDGHLFTAPHGSYPLTWSDLGAGLDALALLSFASFRDASQDALYLADGGQLHRYKSSGITLNLPGTPTVKRLAVQNLRLFACGDASAPETLYFSGLNNGDTLGQASLGGGAAIIRTFAHEPLTTLLPVGQSLLIFHERGISRFTGWSQADFNIDSGTRGLTQDVGTIAPNSVAGVENVGFFLSDRGVYQVTESGVSAISRKIENLLASVNSTDLARASSGHNHFAREVWFAIPNLGVMVYNYRIQAWTGPFSGVYVTGNPVVFWESGAGPVPTLFFGGSDAVVRQADVLGTAKDDISANGTGGLPYSMNVRCHRMFFGDPASEKSLRWAYVTANLRGSANAAISWETGEEAGTMPLSQSGTVAVWNAMTWNAFTWGVGGSSTSPVHAHGRGRYADVRLTDDGVTNPVFSRVELTGFEMGRR